MTNIQHINVKFYTSIYHQNAVYLVKCLQDSFNHTSGESNINILSSLHDKKIIRLLYIYNTLTYFEIQNIDYYVSDGKTFLEIG